MDLSNRLTERFGTPAERFFVNKRKGEIEKAEAVLKDLLPGDEIELPISFKIKHSVHLGLWGSFGIPWDDSEIEVNADTLTELDTQLLTKALPANVSLGRASYGTVPEEISCPYISFFSWDVVFESCKPFDVEKLMPISDSQLKHFGDSTQYLGIAKFAKLLIDVRKVKETERLSAMERSKKEAEKREIATKRKELQNKYIAKFREDEISHMKTAYTHWQTAIGSLQLPLSPADRKAFANIANISPYKIVLFDCLDNLQRAYEVAYSPDRDPADIAKLVMPINLEDIETSFKLLTDKSLRSIVSELYQS